MDSKIFLSYSWKDIEIADTIDKDFQILGIRLIRDTRELDFKNSIKQYMKSIRDSDYVLMLISENYLKSKNCMYEVLEFIKDETYKSRILPIILKDANIYSIESRIEYINYWQSYLSRLRDSLLTLDVLNASALIEDIRIFEQISRTVDQFISTLNDIYSVPLNTLKQIDYQPILDFIGYSYNELLVELFNIYHLDTDIEIKESMIDRFISSHTSYAYGYHFKGLILHQQGRHKIAISNFLKSLELNPSNIESLFNIGVCYYALDEYDEAKKVHESILSSHPDYPDIHGCLGSIYEELKQFSKAEEMYKEEIKLSPLKTSYYHFYCKLLLDLGKYKEALDICKKTLIIDENDYSAFNYMGNIYSRLGNIDEAEQYYNSSLLINPINVSCINDLGNHFFNVGRLQDSMKQYEKAIELAPTDATYHGNLANVLVELGNFSEAEREFNNAILLDKTQPRLYANLSILYFKKGLLEDAIKVSKDALKIFPDFAFLYYNLGNIYRNIGNFSEALRNYKKAYELNNNDFPICFELANMHSELENYSESVPLYKKCVEYNISLPDVYYNLANTYIKLEQYTEALEMYDSAININSEHINAIFNKANTLLKHFNKLNDAKLLFEKVITLDANFVDAYCNLGSIYYIFGDLETSRDLLTKAIQLNPKHDYNMCGAYFNLASIENLLGNKEKSIEYNKIAILIEPSLSKYEL